MKTKTNVSAYILCGRAVALLFLCGGVALSSASNPNFPTSPNNIAFGVNGHGSSPSDCTPNDYTITTTTGSIVPGTDDIGNHCDDCTTTITLPFPVILYDLIFTEANLSSNGNVQFTSNNESDFGNGCLPTLQLTNMIAPWWDDLYTGDVDTGQGIFTALTGTAPNRSFNIEWRANFCCATGAPVNFELRLHENSPNFEIIYGDLSGFEGGAGDSATIGVERDTGSHFTQYECNTPGTLDTDLQLNFVFALGCASPTPTPTPCALAAPKAQNETNVTFNSFMANWKNVSGATGYRLDVATTNNFTTYVPGYQDLPVGNTTSFPVTGLSANTHYYYRVRANNGCGTSPNSNVIDAQTLPCTPAAPNAQPATDVAVSSFTANWNNVNGAIGYQLDVSTNNNFTTYVYQNLDAGNLTSFPVTGLSANTNYYYRVRAYNGCATSSNSNVRSVQTLPCTPAAPNAQPATDVAVSSFTANWNNVNGAIDYRLDVSTNNNFTTYVPGYQDLPVGNTTSFPVTGLSENTNYYYRVRAYNGCATSPNSNVRSVKTKPH